MGEPAAKAHTAAPPNDVAAIFAGIPAEAQKTLLRLREMIFEAADQAGAAPLTETLKWGEPAYLTDKTRSGSTVRLGCKAARPAECALLVNCRTSLVGTFKARHPSRFRFEGSRALIFEAGAPLPEEPLRDCLKLALTYHRWRRSGSPP